MEANPNNPNSNRVAHEIDTKASPHRSQATSADSLGHPVCRSVFFYCLFLANLGFGPAIAITPTWHLRCPNTHTIGRAHSQFWILSFASESPRKEGGRETDREARAGVLRGGLGLTLMTVLAELAQGKPYLFALISNLKPNSWSLQVRNVASYLS